MTDNPEVRLTPRESDVVRRYVAGDTADSIATQLGIDVKTVREYIVRARARYREHGIEVSSKIALLNAFRNFTPGA